MEEIPISPSNRKWLRKKKKFHSLSWVVCLSFKIWINRETFGAIWQVQEDGIFPSHHLVVEEGTQLTWCLLSFSGRSTILLLLCTMARFLITSERKSLLEYFGLSCKNLVSRGHLLNVQLLLPVCLIRGFFFFFIICFIVYLCTYAHLLKKFIKRRLEEKTCAKVLCGCNEFAWIWIAQSLPTSSPNTNHSEHFHFSLLGHDSSIILKWKETRSLFCWGWSFDSSLRYW